MEPGRPGQPDAGALVHHREHGRDRRGASVDAVDDRDFAAKVDLAGLPTGQRVFYEVSFLDLADLKTASEPVRGSFVTPPAEKRNLRFVWSGDTVGQGWGINPDLGGMRIYETMRQVEPDFFIHSGDTIYADGPVYAEARTQDGKTWLGGDGKPWRNLAIPEKRRWPRRCTSIG